MYSVRAKFICSDAEHAGAKRHNPKTRWILHCDSQDGPGSPEICSSRQGQGMAAREIVLGSATHKTKYPQLYRLDIFRRYDRHVAFAMALLIV